MSIVLTGAARLVLDPAEKTADPSAFLKVRKTRKFMGTQDDLAVVAVGRALADAALTIDPDRAGLYAAIGFIPFERSDIEPVLAGSLTNGAFDLRRFNSEGYLRAHPLLTFRCLPNMPAFHVSSNFGITGPYFVTYPGAGQAYLALDEAKRALDANAIDAAVVFATAHQRNFLVEHHHQRLDHPVAPDALRDAACALILERSDAAKKRGAKPKATLEAVSVGYLPFDPLESDSPPPSSTSTSTSTSTPDLGAATPFLAIATQLESLPFSHSTSARDGITGSSTWLSP
jgi:3-oxoacyl-(acyl-carrier-protein) synthase